MNLSDKIYTTKQELQQDENLDYSPLKATVQKEFLAKCVITPNSSSQQVKGNDGTVRDYAFTVFYRKPRGKELPKLNEIVHLAKKDGSIDTDCIVVGVVTLRNWVKIWTEIWV